MNIKLVIEYDGTNYYGWQRQKNKPTIQKTIEDSLNILFPDERIKLIGSGRTDSGVHALNQVANFIINDKYLRRYSLNKLLNSINSLLPPDISVKKVSIADNNFNSRYSAKKRVYKYYLSTQKRGFFKNRYYFIKTKFDIKVAKRFCSLLKGENYFKYLCKEKSDKHNFLVCIYYASVKRQKDGLIVFEICANRFLHSMVRAIVGAMLMVASAKISIEEFISKLKNKEPLKIQYAPSQGLVLEKIFY